MLNYSDQVQQLLRPSEKCEIICEAIDRNDITQGNPLSNLTRRDTLKILALISTVNNGVEEGCIFVFLPQNPIGMRLEMTIPLYYDFRISIVQGKPVNLEDQNSILESKSEFILKIQSSIHQLNLVVKNLELIQDFIKHIKILAQVAQKEGFRPEGTNHQWIQFYSTHLSLQTPGLLSHQLPNIKSPTSSDYTTFKSLNPSILSELTTNPLISTDPAEDLTMNDGLATVENNLMAASPGAKLVKIREEWVRKEMKAREDQFTSYGKINVFCGTWNVNGKPPKQSLEPWLVGASECDLLVLGFQELDLSAEAYLLTDGLKEEEWTQAILEGLGKSSTQFTKIVSKQLVGILMIVFASNTLLPNVADITTDSAGCGIMGMMGNKGGVAARIKVFDSYFCFVNSHLAADSGQVQRRNQDHQEISRRMGFPPLVGPATPSSSSSMNTLRHSFHPSHRQALYGNGAPSNANNYLGNRNIQRPCTIFEVDHLFWIGDLNYRLTLPNDQVRQLIQEKKYDELLSYDQLNDCIQTNKSFVNFKEGKIEFQPTYKFDVGTDNYDSSEKKRVPSYCDRILWRCLDDDHQVELTEYQSAMALTSSDHKPVRATFKVVTKTLAMDAYLEVYSSMIRELDKFENSIMPDAKISETQLDFGEVRYASPKERSLVIENIGQVYLQYQFIPKMNEATFCKPWIWVNPPSGVILPGEKARVNFIMLVDNRSAPKLNTREDKLEDILILHLERGKDYFISVSATYCPTTFAIPLEYLCRLPCPIRDLGDQELLPIENQLSVPQVVWRMVGFIYDHGTSVDNLFLTPGDREIMEHISDCLDTGAEFDMAILGAELVTDSEEEEEGGAGIKSPPAANPLRSDGVHSMSETLIRFLEALPEPLIPIHLYKNCLDAAVAGREATLQALETLPRVNLNVFLYLTSFLREILPQSSHMDFYKVERIAVVFSSVILRTPEATVSHRDSTHLERGKWFLLHFILDENSPWHGDQVSYQRPSVSFDSHSTMN